MVNKSILALVLLGVCANAHVLLNDPFYCYSKDYVNLQYKYFGSTTPYDQVRGKAADWNKFSKCKPARFWLQGRHGSRYPDGEPILSATDTTNQQVVANYNSFKAPTLCPSDVKLLKDWTFNTNFTTLHGMETESGWTELTKLAQRYQAAFPTLLPKTYSPSFYYFRHSPVPRTLDSARAFARGLFNGNYNQVTYEGGSLPDNFLVPFYSCPAWFSQLTSPLPEVQAFQQTSYYLNMVKQVSEKAGFRGAAQLSSDVIERLMNQCRFEEDDTRNDASAWCSLFSYANHQVLVYEFDLQFAIASGYSNPGNRALYENMGCTMVNAMLKYLQSNDPNDQKAMIWYGHDVTLQVVYVALGWFEDEVPLSASNFATQQQRKWSTSQITPMGANLVAIRYDCPNGDNEVLFLLNEKPVQIQGCLNGLCKVSMILQRYSRFLNANCDDIVCSNTRLQ